MYSILKSYPIEYDCRSDDNHIYIHCVADNQDYSVAVNVESNVVAAPLFFVDKEIDYHRLAPYLNLAEGLHEFSKSQWMPYLKYYDQNWVQKSEMTQAEIKHSPTNQFGCTLMKYVDQVMADPTAYMLVFGMKWGPKSEPEWTFGFTPALGLHDVHYNDGVHDGACFFVWPDSKRVIGVFTEFRKM